MAQTRLNEKQRSAAGPKSKSASSAFISVLIISVLLRVVVALYYGNIVDAPPLLTDQRSYDALGARLLAGQGFSFARAWYPFTPANTPTSHWSFLYSLIVAAVYAVFGAHPLAMRLFQAVAGGILLPYMVYRLTKTLFFYSPPHPLTPSPTLPLIAAGCAAIYGYFIMYAATIMTETFYITTLLWSLEIALRIGSNLRAGQRISWQLTLQLGLSLGIATLLRQSILPWVPVLFLWLLLNVYVSTRSHVRTSPPSPPHPHSLTHPIIRLTIAGLILIACIAPFTYRNYRVYGQFLLLNSNTGYAMYSAQHPMHGTRFREFDAAPLPADLERINEAQMDRELLRRGIQFVLDEPGRYLLLSLSRVRAYFEFWPTPGTTLLHNIGRVGSFGLFLPFMLYGLILNLKNSKSASQRVSEFPNTQYAIRNTHYAVRITDPSSLLYLFILFYSVLHIFTWAMVRYRLPVDAVLLPFAALAIEDLFTRIRAHVRT